MDRDYFFRSIRQTLYKGGVPQSAVEALDLFLTDTDGKGYPAEHVAYMLATAYHEVGPGLVPKRESLNYSVSGLLSTFGRHRISEADARRLGPYLKVLRSGRVTAGDEIVIEYRPEGAPTILDVDRAP